MMTPDANPVLQLLIARKHTVPLKQREIAASLQAWLMEIHPSVCEILSGVAIPAWSQKDFEAHEATRHTSQVYCNPESYPHSRRKAALGRTRTTRRQCSFDLR